MLEPALAFLIAALVSMAVGPKMISALAGLRLRQTVSEDVQQHSKKQGTPMMGGLIILAGAAVGLGALRLARGELFDPADGVLPVVLLTLVSAGVGFVDDYLIATRGKNLGLKARQKLAAQFVTAALFVAWVSLDRAGSPTLVALPSGSLDLGWAYYPLAVLMIVGMSNAMNLTDGLDGLLAGLMVPFALTLGLCLLLSGHEGLSIFTGALAGACLGFLWFNCNPARVFMGDIGSLGLGAAVAGIAVAGRVEVFYLLAGVIFLVEAFSVMLQVASFKATGRRIFRMTPIHHHFELLGWPEQRIVVRFWILQLMVCVALAAWLVH